MIPTLTFFILFIISPVFAELDIEEVKKIAESKVELYNINCNWHEPYCNTIAHGPVFMWFFIILAVLTPILFIIFKKSKKGKYN